MSERNRRSKARLLPNTGLTASQARIGEAVLSELRALRCDIRELIAITRGDGPMGSDDFLTGAHHALPPMMTIREAGKLLRTSPHALYMRIRRGEMPGVVRVGRRRLMVKTDEFLRDLRRMPTPE